jgi:GAF domain-containing protein
MLHEGQIVGAITVARAEIGRFTDKEANLLQTFADQAVIAIENALVQRNQGSPGAADRDG